MINEPIVCFCRQDLGASDHHKFEQLERVAKYGDRRLDWSEMLVLDANRNDVEFASRKGFLVGHVSGSNGFSFKELKT